MLEGYFVAFRSVGLPIRTEDYADPHSPNDLADPSRIRPGPILITP